MGTDEDLEAAVTVGGKKYPLNYHEIEVQFENAAVPKEISESVRFISLT